MCSILLTVVYSCGLSSAVVETYAPDCSILLTVVSFCGLSSAVVETYAPEESELSAGPPEEANIVSFFFISLNSFIFILCLW